MVANNTGSSTKVKRRFGNVGKRRGATVRDVPTAIWIRTMAHQLKKEGRLFVPSCTDFVKTGHGRERAPQHPDWYYIRCAAVLRRVYLRPGVGTGGLSKVFANKKNRGARPEMTVRASRGLLHWCCRSLEGIELITKGRGSGRVITKEGRRRVDTIAFQVLLHHTPRGVREHEPPSAPEHDDGGNNVTKDDDGSASEDEK